MVISSHLQDIVDLSQGKNSLVSIEKGTGLALESVWMLCRKHNSHFPAWHQTTIPWSCSLYPSSYTGYAMLASVRRITETEFYEFLLRSWVWSW